MTIIPIDEVVHFDFITSHPTTQAATDADSTPTFDVFEEDTDTPILSAQNATKRTSKTGNYRGSFTASAANGLEVGKCYSVTASATVNSVAGKGVVLRFRCGPAESEAGVPMVRLTTAGVAAIWDALVAGITTANSIGKRIVDYLTGDVYGVVNHGTYGLAALKTLIDAVQTSVTAVDDYVDGEITQILTAVGTTLDDYVDDLETRLTAALATALQAHALGVGRLVVGVGSTTTAVVFDTVNGAAPSAVNDFYKGRHIVFTSGALTLQATSITSYDGATTTATVPTITGAPVAAVTAIIV